MYSEEQKDKFFEGIAETNNVTASSKLAGVSKTTGYRIREKYPEEYEEAHKGYLDHLDSMFHDAVINGTWEDIVFEGRKTGERKFKQSPVLLNKLLEAKHPDYKQRQAVEMSGSLALESKSDDELLKELALLRQVQDDE